MICFIINSIFRVSISCTGKNVCDHMLVASNITEKILIHVTALAFIDLTFFIEPLKLNLSQSNLLFAAKQRAIL